LDQYLIRHAEDLINNPPERAIINPNHLVILLNHIQCAAYELPFQAGDRFGNVSADLLEEYLTLLAQDGTLHRSDLLYRWMKNGFPAGDTSLRTASPERIKLVEIGEKGPRTIGEVDITSAYWMVHPQAIYLHQGNAFLVNELDLEGLSAYLQPVDYEYYTQPATNIQISMKHLDEKIASAAHILSRGDVKVISQVTGFKKIAYDTHEILGDGPVELPPVEFPTRAVWVSLQPDFVNSLREMNLWGNDPNQYGPGWKKLSETIRFRDGYTCRNCGKPEVCTAHHVHHKVPFRMFTNLFEANRPENLITLCPNCHQSAESIIRVRSGLAGAAHLLRNLAPLFALCDPADIEVLADPNSTLDDGASAIIFYDSVPGGIGLSDELFHRFPEFVRAALDQLVSCTCPNGCPGCVGPVLESEVSQLATKRLTLGLLDALRG
jgi:DEAD/DEAH box helicase domain-containing protein